MNCHKEPPIKVNEEVSERELNEREDETERGSTNSNKKKLVSGTKMGMEEKLEHRILRK